MPVYRDPVHINCTIYNRSVPFELDTGAAVSTISEKFAYSLNLKIRKSTKIIKAYGNNAVNLVGEVYIPITYDNVTVKHTFYVISNTLVNLLGRDLFNDFKFQIVHKPDYYSVNRITSDIYEEFAHYFSENFESNVKDLVRLNVQDGAIPIYCKARTVPVRLKEQLKQELNRLVSSGIISKVHSSCWASPIVTVIKKSGELRICSDFSATINKYIKPVNCVLPTIDQVINSVGQAKVFSKIDLSQAFLQLPIHPDFKEYLVVNTPEGLFKYNFLPFGCTASSGIFQSFMCKILDNIPGVVIYQDDVLVMSSDHESHKVLLRTVLNRLKDAGLKLQYKKCSFFTEQIDYLGYIFNSNGVYANPDKINAILHAPIPNNVKQVQSFVGLCNFYSRFIPNFSHYMTPMYKLLKKNTNFDWTDVHQQSFQKLKELFVSENILSHYNAEHDTSIETDASSYGVGAVLLQRPNKNSRWVPVQFASRTLNNAEQSYSQIEREAASVIFAVDKFRQFLLGSHFTIFNDHKPLFTLFAKDKPVPISCSARVQRWALKLSQYDYSFVYSKGSDNMVSDFLSRLPLSETVTEVEPYELICAINTLNESLLSHEIVKEYTERDKNLTQLKFFIKYGCPNKIVNKELSQYKSHVQYMTIVKGCILFHNRVLIPVALRERVLDLFHQNHPGIVAMKSLARSLIWFPGLDRDVEYLVKSCNVCQSVRNKPSHNSHVSWPSPSRPWQRLHIDHFHYENKTCLIVIDALSKYIEVEIVKNLSVEETIDTLRIIFSRHGLPDIICSDNATSFSAALFSSFLNSQGIEHVTSPPYSPSSNGQAEVGVRVIKSLLRKQQQGEPLRNRLARVLFYYRCVPHNITQIAPAVALNNRRLVSLKDRINPIYSNSKSNLQGGVRQLRQFEIGDDVLALNMRGGPKWYKARVVQKLAINVYEVLVPELDVIWKRHWNQLSFIPAATNASGRESEISQDESTLAPRRGVRDRRAVVRLGVSDDGG